MPPVPVSRRAFLAGGAGTVLAAATAGALVTGPASALLPAKQELSVLVPSSDLYAADVAQRFAFVVYRGPRPASTGRARVAFAAPDADRGEVLDAELHTDGLPKGRGVFVTQAVFPVAGAYRAIALVKGKRVPFAVQVNPTPEAPVIGDPASTAPSPTTADALGVNPICTRQPACPLHDVSLAQVIGSGKPVAVMFATPALCQTQYCGPVLDEMLDVMDPYRERGVQFVHVDIYASNRGTTLSPTVEAWGLPSEPWFYTVDGAGIIRDRLDGAFATDEVTAALDRLVGAS